MQLAAIGKPRRPGQRIRFWLVRGEPEVHAWDLPVAVETAVLDTDRYHSAPARRQRRPTAAWSDRSKITAGGPVRGLAAAAVDGS